jgi:hypothetical protein
MEFTLPGQASFNAFFNNLLDFVLSGTQVQDLTREDVRGGWTGTSSPAQGVATNVYTGVALSGPQAEAFAREDQMNALRDEVAREKEAADALVNANQQAQQAAAAAAAAAADRAAASYFLSGNSLIDQSPGLTSVSPDLSAYSQPNVVTESYRDETNATSNATAGAGTQTSSSEQTGDREGATTQGTVSDEGVVSNVSQAGTLSDLPVTEIANAPSIFDLSTLDNLAGRANAEDGFYAEQVVGDGGSLPRLTEEELLAAAQLAQANQAQQESFAPTVAPIKYDISKFISGIGSLATSKQT